MLQLTPAVQSAVHQCHATNFQIKTKAQPYAWDPNTEPALAAAITTGISLLQQAQKGGIPPMTPQKRCSTAAVSREPRNTEHWKPLTQYDDIDIVRSQKKVYISRFTLATKKSRLVPSQNA